MVRQTLILTEDHPNNGCRTALAPRLLQQPGIRAATLSGDDGVLTLELKYDPRLITWRQVEHEIRAAGATLKANRAAILLRVSGLTSPRAEGRIEAVLSKMPGVAASVSHSSGTIRIEFDRRACAVAEIVGRLDRLGIRVLRADAVGREDVEPGGAATPDTAKPQAARWWEEYIPLGLAALGAVLLLAGFLVHVLEGPQWLRLALVGACYLIAGWHTAIDTLRVLRQFRFDIDVLMFAAAIGAAALGHYEEGGLLLVLFAFGGAGEELALGKARSAIHALAKLAPETATVRDASGEQRQVKVELLKVGDEVIVRPFDRLPADGVVATGNSSIDQSPITGESVPVEKSPGSGVFAGTINGQGLLTVRVSKLAGETTVAKIVRMVNEAQTTKSPTQLFTDKVERVYVPLVLLSTTLLIFLPPLLGGGAWSTCFYRAMAFLTAASPCALAIGTPAAVLSGIARAARLGVLVKGGAHLESLGRINAIAFDKTGTLTPGKPTLTDVVNIAGPAGAEAENEILRLAAAVEAGSTHPLARAIVAAAEARGLTLPQASSVQQISGKGVTARVGDKSVAVGKLSVLPPQATPLALLQDAIARLSSEGKTTVVVGVEGLPIGVIALADRPRASAAPTIARLHELGIRKTIMLTGDNAAAAEAIARQVGVDEHHAQLLPEDKVDKVRQLAKHYGGVAMVGDGVNDAPAMAAATVGIAMGGAGTDVAIETADVALMADDLSRLPDAIGLSRFSRKIITQNLVIALGVIAVLAPLSALGYTYLGVAVLFHEGSTVVVVLNSLRLLVWKGSQRG